MKRRINSTGRRSIPLEKIAIRLIDGESPSAPKSFTADLVRLSELRLDPNARVYVEPYVSTSSMRFPFGTAGALNTPDDTRLIELDAGGSILFRVKVVDESKHVGRILASVNEVRPKNETEDQDDEKAILPLRLRDLGEAVWMVDIAGAARPELVINNRIPGFADRLKMDPLIQGAIIPHAMARVLEAALKDNNADDTADWVQDWRKFATSVLGEEIPDDLDPDDLDGRIKEVVEKFVNRMKFATKIAAASPITGALHD